MQTKEGCRYRVACVAGGRRVAKVGKRHFVTHADKEFCPLCRLGTWEREIFVVCIVLVVLCFSEDFLSL